MTPADFEESEYRGPLYNQLEQGNNLIWEPGQVFEKHIGIDRAAYVTNPYFWSLHGLPAALQGVVLDDFDWSYIWRDRLSKKLLPDFKLNLFLQAKRPYVGTRPRKNIKDKGIVGGYWKFNITPHQQKALERMNCNLSKRALVCYASPAFHSQLSLYTHTKENTIVQSSTFPAVASLVNHGAWYYNCGGLFGVANPDPERIDVKPLQERILEMIERAEQVEQSVQEGLVSLAGAIVESQQDIIEPSLTDIWFQQRLNQVEAMLESISEFGLEPESKLSVYRAYFQIRAFCAAHHLGWYVIGKGS